MIKNYLLLLICYLVSSSIHAQEVESTAYDVMLSTLLGHSVPEVSVAEMKSNEVILLDAREKEEYNVSRIKGAHWVGYDDFSLERVEEFSKNQELVVYCSVGYRSDKSN
ncbi:putative sulfurtransferase [Catalinimonas alkaloidigena]|uniref:rhodanese-like domain-containing protein n=1 Tax=Catalinimonas alkaloidigena TaxID=1075417 RepID=UPI0030B8F597|nr:putative sulfurtransferase [Catalinimonas alkaloidigena]